MIYKNLIKPCLFSLDPETAHELGAKVLQFMGKSRFACSLSRKLLLSNKQPVEIFGLKFLTLSDKRLVWTKMGFSQEHLRLWVSVLSKWEQ